MRKLLRQHFVQLLGKLDYVQYWLQYFTFSFLVKSTKT